MSVAGCQTQLIYHLIGFFFLVLYTIVGFNISHISITVIMIVLCSSKISKIVYIFLMFLMLKNNFEMALRLFVNSSFECELALTL